MVNVLNETLKMALDYASIRELPELSVEPYKTRAIVKVSKFAGSDCYCIGKFEEMTRKTAIIKDFFPQGGHITEILAVYPIKEKELPSNSTPEYDNYTIDELRAEMDKHNIPYPQNKKNDKKWMAKRLETTLADREAADK